MASTKSRAKAKSKPPTVKIARNTGAKLALSANGDPKATLAEIRKAEEALQGSERRKIDFAAGLKSAKADAKADLKHLRELTGDHRDGQTRFGVEPEADTGAVLVADGT